MFEDFKIPKELIPSDPRFGVGPTLIHQKTVDQLAATGPHLLGTSHRKPTVKNLVKEIQDGLRAYFKLPNDYLVAMGNGGATLLFDAIGLGLVRKKIAHFTCGEFSQKWYKASKQIPWIDAEEKAADFGQSIAPTAVPDADVIAITLNETSTGVMNLKLPEPKPEVLSAVDATSGGGQIPCQVTQTDLFFFSPQKVFAAEGGLFVAVMSPKAKERALEIVADKERYIPKIMDWKPIIENSEKNQTYNTPALANLFFLARQIELMNRAGREKIEEEAGKKARLLYNWAEQSPYLYPYVKEEKARSLSVATICVDDKIDVEALLKHFAHHKVVYNIDPYRKLGLNQFRIGMFPNISYEDLEKLTKLIDTAIKWKLNE